jgi:hypothetical protein
MCLSKVPTTFFCESRAIVAEKPVVPTEKSIRT